MAGRSACSLLLIALVEALAREHSPLDTYLPLFKFSPRVGALPKLRFLCLRGDLLDRDSRSFVIYPIFCTVRCGTRAIPRRRRSASPFLHCTVSNGKHRINLLPPQKSSCAGCRPLKFSPDFHRSSTVRNKVIFKKKSYSLFLAASLPQWGIYLIFPPSADGRHSARAVL